MAALHADHADRPRHIGGHDGNDTLRSGQRIHAQSCREAIDCCPGEINRVFKGGQAQVSAARTAASRSREPRTFG